MTLWPTVSPLCNCCSSHQARYLERTTWGMMSKEHDHCVTAGQERGRSVGTVGEKREQRERGTEHRESCVQEQVWQGRDKSVAKLLMKSWIYSFRKRKQLSWKVWEWCIWVEGEESRRRRLKSEEKMKDRKAPVAASRGHNWSELLTWS